MSERAEPEPAETGRPAEAGAEPVEHIDADGAVIEVVTRAEIRARRLRHRCTYIAVLTSDDRLVVHRRADWKDVFGGHWDVCFGGICGVGESWEEAARRELSEESGLSGDLVDLGAVAYDEGPGSSVGAVSGRAYLLRSDDEPRCPDGEVVEIDRVHLDDLERWLGGRPICRDSLAVVVPLLLDLRR